MAKEIGELEAELRGIAGRNWLKTKNFQQKKQFDAKVVSKILETIRSAIVSKTYNFRELASLVDSLNYLELYLWQHLSEDSTNDHVVSVAMCFVFKQMNKNQWMVLITGNVSKFKIIMKRVLTLILSITSKESVSSNSFFSLRYLVNFLTLLVNNLEVSEIRSEFAPLFSVGILANIPHIEFILDNNIPFLKKSYKSFNKKFAGADPDSKSVITFQKNWLFTFFRYYQNLLLTNSNNNELVIYSQAVICFATDVMSQLPTGRFTNLLVKEVNLLATISDYFSTINFADQGCWQLFEILRGFIYFPVDRYSGMSKDESEVTEAFYEQLDTLKQIAYEKLPEQLEGLVFAKLSDLLQKEKFKDFFNGLTLEETTAFADALHLNTDGLRKAKDAIIEALFYKYIGPFKYSKIVGTFQIMPTEKLLLFNDNLFSYDNHDDIRLLARPLHKLGLQFLSINDFLSRNFNLLAHQANYQVRIHLENVLEKIRVKQTKQPDRFYGDNLAFSGFSKYAMRIKPMEILHVSPVLIASASPSYVKAEIQLNYYKLNKQILDEWDSLSEGEAVFLLSIGEPAKKPKNMLEQFGIKLLRTATVLEIVKNPPRHSDGANNFHRLYVNLDLASFATDDKSIYKSINMIVRREKNENNFKVVLSNIAELMTNDFNLPYWLVDILLGYGDPKAGYYKNQANRPLVLDFANSFESYSHIKDCFPGMQIDEYELEKPTKRRKTTKRTVSLEKSPPVIIDFSEEQSKKLKVFPYIKENYEILTSSQNDTFDKSKKITKQQVDAVVASLSPGLTLISGSTQSCKNELASHIVSLLYGNFPIERTLIITHNNLALDHIVSKIKQLGNVGNLLRLGNTELIGDSTISKDSVSNYDGTIGKVETLMEDLRALLQKVNRLAESLNIEGYHGNNSETALTFYHTHVQHLWKEFLVKRRQQNAKFPFEKFVKTELSLEGTVEDDTAAIYYYKCIKRIFAKIESYKPFEVLQSDKSKADFMLRKQANVVGMTAKHLSMHISEFKKIGVEFDNIIIGEADQQTTFESFLPLTLAATSGALLSNRLKRYILIGDLQGSPVVQNRTLFQYSGLDVSLFENLSKLGVPSIILSDQEKVV